MKIDYSQFDEIINFIRNLYKTDKFIPLHEPKFIGNEKKYLAECIDSTFVSSVGEFVNRLEVEIAKYTTAKYAVATVNGTSALHASLIACDTKETDEVITQSLTFIATVNAIKYTRADPLFIDVDKNSFSLSSDKLKTFLQNYTEIRDDGFSYNKKSGKRIKACIPMHTFGHIGKIDEIVEICNKYNIDVIEDAAEALGSSYKKKHAGTFGKVGILSFNGNKIITSGGGGAIITDDAELAKTIKHLTTTAKIPHPWEFIHDEIGFNYRMPNINAALAYAQLEKLDEFISNKREISNKYNNFFKNFETIHFLTEPKSCFSNHWLNTIIFSNKEEKESFLHYSNKHNVMTRSIWEPMHQLKMFKDCIKTDLVNTEWLYDRAVNIPSSAIV